MPIRYIKYCECISSARIGKKGIRLWYAQCAYNDQPIWGYKDTEEEL